MVARGLVELPATRGLEQKDDIAEAVGGQVEGIAADERVGGRIAPTGSDGGADFLGERGEEFGVAGERQDRVGMATPRIGVGWAGLEEGYKVCGRGGICFVINRWTPTPGPSPQGGGERWRR